MTGYRYDVAMTAKRFVKRDTPNAIQQAPLFQKPSVPNQCPTRTNAFGEVWDGGECDFLLVLWRNDDDHDAPGLFVEGSLGY